MNKTKYALEQFYIAKNLFRWTLLIFPVAISVGLLVALFLWLLDIATAKTCGSYFYCLFQA